jgi:GNAT superfamily N-acetyltransferase
VIVVEPFGRGHLEGFRTLFEASSSPCFCRYWHFTGTKNEWLDRCANHPEENLAEQAEALRNGDPSARGLVALEDGAIVGWMKVAPREAMPKLTSLPVYRGLAFVAGTWTLGCLLVHPSARRCGVARALVRAAETHVRAWGGRALEGHPRRSEAPLYDEEAWQGPERVFIECGFEPVHDVAPYPVYRKLLLHGQT